MKSCTRAIAFMFFWGTVFAPGFAAASVIVSWDWNDGTTQGWVASSSEANVDNQFEATNSGNGSLQMFGPDISAVDLTPLTTIRFDLTVLSYSTVSSPSELVRSDLVVAPLMPGEPLFWELDLSGLAFGETRAFTLSIDDAEGSPRLEDLGFVSIALIPAVSESNSAVALLDNFVMSGAMVPVPSTLFLFGVGIFGLIARSRVSKHRVLVS